MSIANNDMATTLAQFEPWLDASSVLQSLQTGVAELTRRLSSVELRMDRGERQGEIAIERISALTGAVSGIDQRLMRVEERGVRLEEQLKAHVEQTQHNFDSFREHFDALPTGFPPPQRRSRLAGLKLALSSGVFVFGVLLASLSLALVDAPVSEPVTDQVLFSAEKTDSEFESYI